MRFNIVFIEILEFEKSLMEIPEIYEIYAGISGNTQGDRNDKKPATSALIIFTSSMFLKF